jgi:hypothetical protein
MEHKVIVDLEPIGSFAPLFFERFVEDTCEIHRN